MESLGRLAAELSIPERTVRRAAQEGLIHGERLSPRRFRTTLREENYLRRHWPLLRALRGALRTEPNVELAVLFGSTAIGTAGERSDVDIVLAVTDPGVGRIAETSERISRRVGREVQLVRLADAEASPMLMDEIISRGRVLIDRHHRWPALRDAAPAWRRRARRGENLLAASAPESGWTGATRE
jgi:predicted nucleotidyltransferase